MRIKYLILSLILLAMMTLYASQSQLNIAAPYNQDILYHPMNTNNSIVLTEIPMDMYKPNRTFKVSWQPSSINAKFYYSQSPGGPYTMANVNSSATGNTRTISTNAQQLGIGVGLYYCVIKDPNSNDQSMEFQLIIQPSSGVATAQPLNGSTITNNATPTFSWQPISGVPYYYIVLSDQPFTLSYDENDKLIVNGLNLIWQAITPNTSITYGSPDPSDNFNHITPPPLINGKEYNWVVMSNFGNSPLYSSDVTGNPSSFYYSSPTIPAPVLSQPTANQNFVNAKTITFQWDNIPSAVTYHIFLYEKRVEAGSEVLYPIWNQITTNNIVDFQAENVLIQSTYVWKVIATSENNVSASSNVRSFNYTIPTGTANITIKNRQGVSLGFSSVIVDAIEGTMDNVPLTVDAAGAERKLLPVGQYLFSASKAGYETRDTLVTVLKDDFIYQPGSTSFDSTGDTIINIVLDYSPAFLVGAVTSGGNALNNVQVTATKSTGEIRKVSASNGSYSIAVTPGVWTVSAQKEGYTATNTAQTNISSGQTTTMTTIVMNQNTKNISGYTKLPSGSAIATVTVIATKGSLSYTKSTNSNGAYQFNGLEPGTWTISWSKTGYSAPNNYQLTISATSPTNTNLMDALMTPRANVLTGNTGNGTVGIPSCLITATPISGTPITAISNEYGNYTLNIPQGNYTITASKSNYTTQNTRYVNVTVGETIHANDFILYPNQSYINGTVTSSGNPVANANITAGNFTTQTNAAGFFTMSVSAGTYNVVAQKADYITDTKTNISVSIGQTTSGVNFSLNANPGVISGKALLNGSGVASAQITGFRVSGSNMIPITPINTDGLGNYSLNLTAGTYQLSATKTGMLTQNPISVTVAAGATISQKNIVMILNQTTMNGTITNDQGTVVRNANITITEVNNVNNTFSTVTNIYGSYTLNVPASKRYTITASASGYTANSYTMQNPSNIGETYTRNLTIAGQSASISGKIFDQNGNAITNAVISASKGTQTIQINSSATGNYTLGLQYGTWNINVSKLGYTNSDSTFTINPGQSLANKNFIINTNFSTLRGKITNSINANPLQNATVTATSSIGGGGSAITNQNGDYQINNLVPGNYTVTVTRNNYQTATVINLSIPGNQNILKNITMIPLTGELAITCNQTGSTITIENSVTSAINNYTTTAQLTELQGITPQVPLNVTVSKTNYYPQTQSVTIPANGSQSLSFTLVQAIGSISGKITNQPNGAGDGLANAQISAVSTSGGFSGSAISDASGNYVLNNLQTNNTYIITATLSNYNQTNTLSVALPNSTPVQNKHITMIPNNITISGLVKNQLGSALANIPVKAVSEDISIQATTNSAGQFTLNGLSPNKTYQISTNKVQPGWENTTITQIITVNNVTGINLTMQVHTSTLSGIVIDQNTQAPIPGVTVSTYNSLSGLSRTTTTQTDGTYVINNLYNGTLKIKFNKDSYKPDSLLNVPIAYNESITKNIQLQYSQPITVSGLVKDTSNRPQANTQVNISGSGLNLTTTTNSNGEYEFTNVLPYKTNLTIGTNLNPTTHDNASRTFNTANINVQIEPLIIDIHNASISGAVANLSGAFINNALVTLKRLSNNEEISFTTSTNGQFSFTHLYEGDYQLKVNSAGYQSYTSQNIALADNDTQVLPITLQPLEGSIAGFVHNYLGQSVQNATVKLVNENTQSFVLAQTGENGSFTFSATEGINYQLSVTKTGYLNYTHPNTLAVDSIFVNVGLSGVPNSVIGTVKYQNSPIAYATVRAINIQGDTYTTTTNDDGDYIISNIIGYHKVWANSGNLVSYQQEVTIIPGEYIIQDIDLMQAASIPGDIMYNNQGIAGASIIATNVNTGRVFSTSSNTNGAFTLTGLTGATYYIQVIKDGYTVNEEPPTVQVNAGEISDPLHFTLTYMGNSISGSAINNETSEGIQGVVINLKQNDEILNTMNTNSSGSFNFANIADGTYQLSASHGAYNPVDDISVTLLNGVSNPSQVQFSMTPKSKVIYGNVTNTKLDPLPDATVYATIDDNTYQTTTNSNGQYSLSVPNFGEYQVYAKKQYYANSSSVIANLTENNPVAQVSFQLKQLPASISGAITITDQTEEPYEIVAPSQMTVTIYIPEADPIVQVYHDTSDYLIENINLPINNFNITIDIIASYLNNTFKKVQVIGMTPGENTVFDHNFNYIPNSINLGGYVKMKLDENTFDLPTSTKVVISHANTIIDSVNASNSGYYQFNSLIEANFPLNVRITSIYDFEEFSTNIDINWTGDDIILDHFFDYILCEYMLTVMNNKNEPFKFVNVRISGENLLQPINLITDSQGLISTGQILHTGEYSVKINPPEMGAITYLAPNSYTISFDSIGNLAHEKQIPLAFNKSIIEPVASDESINVTLIKAENYTDDVILYYKNLNNVWGSSIMGIGVNNEELIANIPAQNKSGEVKFYFMSESEANGLTYTNQSDPDYWLITSAGIISQNTSSITPNTALITYNQKLTFTADILDELENDLNSIIDLNGSVEWTLADTTLGSLAKVNGQKRSINFYSPSYAENYAQNIIKAKIKLNDITINLSAPITIKEMKLAELTIDGDEEINNSIVNNYYRIIAKSDSGEVMTVTPSIKAIKDYQGSLSINGNLIKLSPQPDYIGAIMLQAKALDPNDSTLVVSGEKEVNVFKLITPNTPADTLDTGLGCQLFLPANMLASGSANIYLNRIQVSAVQQYGTEYDVEGRVFQALSSGNPNFITKPGIAFDTLNEDNINLKTIANWDLDKMHWIHLPSQVRRASSTIIVQEMPNWGQYALLSPSLSLGLYDLKLLPNPFTPNDQIGANKGLQISFKLASRSTRYPKLTCKIYNLNGTLVRTIVNQKAFLKGIYDMGETTSLYWDGKTDDNRMARNGRYVVHLIVEDAKDRKEYVKAIVLIK